MQRDQSEGQSGKILPNLASTRLSANVQDINQILFNLASLHQRNACDLHSRYRSKEPNPYTSYVLLTMQYCSKSALPQNSLTLFLKPHLTHYSKPG